MSTRSNKLHNNNNVYILGAGFSRLRGLPLIGDFMTEMRDALEYHYLLGHQKECKAIEDVLEFRLKASSAAYRVQVDLENIEELFSLASASPSTQEEGIKLAIAATLDYSLHSKASPMASFTAAAGSFEAGNSWEVEALQFDAARRSWKVPAYEYMAKALLGDWGGNDVRKRENSFITFNYDTLLEETLRSLGRTYWLGFDDGSSRETGDIGVFKLHGSVNWTIPKNARTKIQVKRDYRSVLDAGLIPQLIPPTWKKDSRGDFDSIWNQALKALSDATRVVVIGFSMPPTDMHFKYLLAAGLQENYSLREIVFVNPSEGMPTVKERSQHLFANQTHNAAKVRFVESSVQNFVGQGTDLSHVWSISRPIPLSCQGLQFDRYA